MNATLEQFIDNTRQSANIAELFSHYQTLLEQFGFNQICYAVTGNQTSFKEHELPQVIRQKSLQPWIDHYFMKDYMSIDPVHRLGLASPSVYVWKDVVRNNRLSSKQANIFNEAKEASLHHGATIAVHGPSNTKAATLLSCKDKSDELDPRWQDIANLASYQFNLCFLSLINHSPEKLKNSLSAKEQEVLKWIAKGFTKADVSDRLNISPHTADYHIRNILRKLDAKNAAAATAIAVKENFISI